MDSIVEISSNCDTDLSEIENHEKRFQRFFIRPRACSDSRTPIGRPVVLPMYMISRPSRSMYIPSSLEISIGSESSTSTPSNFGVLVHNTSSLSHPIPKFVITKFSSFIAWSSLSSKPLWAYKPLPIFFTFGFLESISSRSWRETVAEGVLPVISLRPCREICSTISCGDREPS